MSHIISRLPTPIPPGRSVKGRCTVAGEDGARWPVRTDLSEYNLLTTILIFVTFRFLVSGERGRAHLLRGGPLWESVGRVAAACWVARRSAHYRASRSLSRRGSRAKGTPRRSEARRNQADVYPLSDGAPDCLPDELLRASRRSSPKSTSPSSLAPPPLSASQPIPCTSYAAAGGKWAFCIQVGEA
jgi:hypothetical protein